MALSNNDTTSQAIVRATKRIDNIASAKDLTEVAFRFGIAVGFINAARELKAVSDDEWARLLASAEHANDNHPAATLKSGDANPQ